MIAQAAGKYPGDFARLTPDKPAIIAAATGQVVTYKQLDQRSNQFARYLHQHGLRRGDHVAVLMENNLRYMELVWAAIRSGLHVTTINRYLTPGEVSYIVHDCGARALVSSHAMRDIAQALTPLIDRCPIRLMVDGQAPGWPSYEEAIAPVDTEPLEPQWMGQLMLYSSGTTGRPKGVLRKLTDALVTDGNPRGDAMRAFGFDENTVYLSPAPMYHAAPVGYTLGTHYAGGTVVMMEKFDALEALRAIETYKVTHSQWVPTMFVRMLKLPQAERERFDLSSHRVAIHAAAPCPVDVKRRMMQWWGPMIYEYYGGSEGNGVTTITPEQWLAHPGSVGRALLGILHVCDDDGNEMPVGEPGTIYFERPELPFTYHNDDAKTRSAQHPLHPNWTTLGDIGYVDADGYLYLTDRRAFMIISGGVNIYPQAIEDALVLHPSVADVAVIGVPNEEYGEEVKAVIEPAPGVAAGHELAVELIEFLRDKVARYMIPRSIDFIDTMPRLPTGKLYKRQLRDRYLSGSVAR